MNDVMHRKRGLGILGIWEKSVEFLPPKKKVDFRSLPRPCSGCRAWWLGRWKSQPRKIVNHSPYVVKPLNSKVIKSFVPELRSRKFFCVSGFLCYLYMSYEHSMYISHIHVFVCDKIKNKSCMKKEIKWLSAFEKDPSSHVYSSYSCD